MDRAYRWEQGFTFEMYMHEDSQTARDAFVETGGAARFGGKSDGSESNQGKQQPSKGKDP